MTSFDVVPFKTSSIAYLHGIRNVVEVDPPYQRQGEVWSVEKQQLLIDSVINGFDVPKIYFHEHPIRKEVGGRRVKFSLVDGRQRLEAIWDFLDGKFALSDDFALLGEEGEDEEDDRNREQMPSPAGLTYSELASQYPDIAALFAATSLHVMVIRTSDVELIEEMFSRLNEAVPLNAAEKRNGRGGPLRSAVWSLTETPFFTDRLPFGNHRYRHLDLATKFLHWEQKGGAADAKKRQLDDFWESYKTPVDGVELTPVESLQESAKTVLKAMEGTFTDSDRLLSSIGMVSAYYLLFREVLQDGGRVPLRADLQSFERVRRLARPERESDLSEAQRDLLEFDRLSQSPNDAGALGFRVAVLKRFLSNPDAFGEVSA